MRVVRAAVLLAALHVVVPAGVVLAQEPEATPPGSTPTEGAPPGSEVIPGQLVSWSIVPATAEGAPAEGVSFRLEVEPGATVTQHALLTNHSEEAVTFDLAAADGVTSPEGNFDILPAWEESSDVGTWVEIQPAVEVPAGGSALVPFTITVPADATPGDHPGGIVAGVTRTTDAGGGPSVGFNTRVGVRIHLRVAGEVVPAVEITDLRTSYDTSWNPLAPGRLKVSYTVTNTGNVRLGSSQQADIAGLFGLPTGADTADGGIIGQQREILPGQSATVDAVVEDVWPLGWVSADVEATQRPVGEDPPFPVTVMAASKGTWAPPWSQLGVVLVVVAVVVLWRKRRAVRRTRYEKAIAEAKAAGAREAAGADSVAGAGELGPLGEPPPVTDDGAIEVAEVEVAEVTDEPVANGVAVGEPVPDDDARSISADSPGRPPR